MGRANNFKKALSHLKSNQIDEKLQMLSEIPTNSTLGMYEIEPTIEVQDPDIPGEVTREANFDKDDLDNGKDTTGLFDNDGTILTIEPPGDTDYILGPMSSMWYAWGNFTQIGYINEDTRRMTNLARITGELDDWDGSSNFTSYGQLTLEQAVWFRDTNRREYRAFYPGPPSSVADRYGRYICSITGTSKQVSITPPLRRTGGTRGGPGDFNIWGFIQRPGIGYIPQFGARLLRSFTDSTRYAGDYMFKGLKAGVEYLPDFTGAAPKSLGGKKWADVFGNLGRTLAGNNYATQYFTPSLNKALDYAKSGGTIVVMPRTGGVPGFKNWFGSSVSRGFGIGDIEKLVRTSDTIKSAQQGTTQIFNLADPKSMGALRQLASQGAKTNTMLGKLGRAVPFVGAAAAIADVGIRIKQGDYGGAILGGISAVPGPIGWIGLGAQVLYDTAAPKSLKNYINKDVPKFYGLSNSYKVDGKLLTEENDPVNSIKQALFELGVPTDRKQFAKEQGTYLTLLGVNPDLVSILTLAMAGEELSSEQKKWIDDNLINMVKVFSNLRDEQEQNPNTQKESNELLSESRQRILRDIKKPVVIPEVKQEKIKHRPRVIGSGPRVVGDDLMKQVECQPSFKQPEDRMWGKFEKNKNARKSQQRKNDVLEIVGASDHAWDYLSENGRKKGEDIVYGNFGGKKIRVVKQENVRSDTLLFLADESGNKTRVLQSEINDNLDYQFNKELFEKYFDEQQTMQYDNDPLFKKVSKRLKAVIDYPDKPAKAGYPDEPPPEMVNGWHPEYGQDKGYYNKLDPQSASSMPNTGNPEIDAKVQKARRIKRIAKGD